MGNHSMVPHNNFPLEQVGIFYPVGPPLPCLFTSFKNVLLNLLLSDEVRAQRERGEGWGGDYI